MKIKVIKSVQGSLTTSNVVSGCLNLGRPLLLIWITESGRDIPLNCQIWTYLAFPMMSRIQEVKHTFTRPQSSCVREWAVYVVRDLDKKVFFHQSGQDTAGPDQASGEEIREPVHFRDGVFVQLLAAQIAPGWTQARVWQGVVQRSRIATLIGSLTYYTTLLLTEYDERVLSQTLLFSNYSFVSDVVSIFNVVIN